MGVVHPGPTRGFAVGPGVDFDVRRRGVAVLEEFHHRASGDIVHFLELPTFIGDVSERGWMATELSIRRGGVETVAPGGVQSPGLRRVQLGVTTSEHGRAMACLTPAFPRVIEERHRGSLVKRGARLDVGVNASQFVTQFLHPRLDGRELSLESFVLRVARGELVALRTCLVDRQRGR